MEHKRSGHRGRPFRSVGRSALLALVVVALAALGLSQLGAAVAYADGIVTTDKADYAPEQTVTVIGGGFNAGASYAVPVIRPDGSVVKGDGTFTPGWDIVQTDAAGGITYLYKLDGITGTYEVRVYPASWSGDLGTPPLASVTFTDAAPSAGLDQCANDPAPSPSTDGCSASASDWVNGNLGASKSVYLEGDSIPYRLVFGDLSLAQHTVVIEWDTTKSGKHAIDYLTTFNRTVATANPCLGVSGCNPLSFTTLAIPPDPQVTTAGVTPVAGSFRLYGGTIDSVSAYSYPDGTGFSGDKSARIAITFTASVANPVLAWGGHISTRLDWGPDSSAVAISGSPYHTRLIGLDGSGGNQDRSLSADAVIFPGSITIVKDATPNGSTSFGFTASPLPLSSFSLIDDGTSANKQVFGNITNFQTYTVNESSIPANWGFDSVSCLVSSPNGGSYTTSTTTVSINIREGENWTCTYLDSIRVGTLTVVKHVVNDNGGTANASAWSLHVKSGGSEVTGSPQAGSETGTSYTLNAGSYNVSETGGPTGYQLTGLSGDCDSSGNVTVVAGQTKTCTLTNNDIAPRLTVIKHVVNDNGGTKAAADFTMSVTGGSPSPSSFPGAESPGTTVTLNAGSYSVGETGPSGYTASFSADCAGSIAVGETKTCTVTNNDQPGTLTVVKLVTNDNGGTRIATNFSFQVNGGAATAFLQDGADTLKGKNVLTVDAGTYNVTEPAVDGYTTTYSTCSGLVIPNGGSATCTVTNDDQPGTLKVLKLVVNDNGGTKVATNFSFQVNGGAATAFLQDGADTLKGKNVLTVNAGTYNVTEPAVGGYTTTYDNCSNVAVANGGSATCTVTNNDQPGTLTVVKHVVNDNGGTANASAWSLHVKSGANEVTGSPQAGSEAGTSYTLNAGAYNVSETGGPSGYQLTGLSGDCDSSGNVTVANGGSVTCTLTNNDIAPRLIVVKHVVNDNGGTKAAADFTMSVTGGSPSPSSFAGAESPGTTVTLNAGSYSVGEAGPSGYTASFSGDCTGSIAVGETKTCTVTNDDQPGTLIVQKVVINDNGGTRIATNFAFQVNGGAATAFLQDGADPLKGKNTLTVNAGTYNVVEPAVYGYTTTYSNCSNVAVANGGSATCTITNDDQPGTIVVIKNAKPAQGSFAFTTTGTGYAGFTLTGATTNDGNKNTQTLNAGTYTAKETTQLGWILTGIGGSTDPNTPTNCVITGSGGSTGVGDLNTQTVTINLKNGDTVTCTFENTGQGVTRTQGFWATHPQLASIAWFGGTAFGHTFPGVANTAGINDRLICGREIDDLGKVMGGFWSDVPKMSSGTKRLAIDQSRMQLLQQLLAAELNASAFGSVPAGGTATFAQWESALCGTSADAIKNAQQQAASFNSAGDSSAFTPGTSADSKSARSVANISFWDVIKP